MKKTVRAVTRLVICASTLAAASLDAQTVTPTSPNGWVLYDGASGTSPATITSTQPFNGNGSLQFTVSNSSQQPSAAYLFGAPVALQGLNSLTLGYSFLTPNGTVPAASPTIRLLLTGISGASQPNGRSDGSLGWYLNGSSNSWNTQSFSLNAGDFFFRLGGVGQSATDCLSSGTSFDDRRQTISAWQTNCNGTGGRYNINTASIIGVQVDWGTFTAPAAATSWADQINFSIGGNSGNYNFETAATVVPEPASVALVGFGIAALGLAARKRKVNS